VHQVDLPPLVIQQLGAVEHCALVLDRRNDLPLPRVIRPLAERHHKLIKFAIVGAATFLIDSGLSYTLKLTVLQPKPVTSKIIAGIVAARTRRDLADQLTARQIERLEDIEPGEPTMPDDSGGWHRSL
jgi:hypothetical protein